MNCKKCGSELMEGVLFCSVCGTKVEEESTTCPSCGKNLLPGSAFCSFCGTKLGENAEAKVDTNQNKKPLNAIVCELCGGNNMIKDDGFFVCQNCGTKYTLEEARKMMIEGTVQVSGVVKVDNTGKISNYLMMANSALNVSNNKEAEEYANKVIEIDPSNCEAWLIKGNASAWMSTLGNLRISESIECWSRAYSCCTENKEGLSKKIIDSLNRVVMAITEMRLKNFVDKPDEYHTKELLKLGEIAGYYAELFKKTGVNTYITMANYDSYLSEKLLDAVNSAIETADNYYGRRPQDQNAVKYPNWLEYMNCCAGVVEFGAQITKGQKYVSLFFQKGVYIQNRILRSKSFRYEGGKYIVDTFPNRQMQGGCARKIKEYKTNEKLYLSRLRNGQG